MGTTSELGDIPANVHVERWVAEADILAHASAAVGHGGAGTTLSALAAGCPLVVVPLFGDQPTNAVRVAVAGAGVVASFEGIRAGLELVLENDNYREASRRISEEMRALPPVDGFSPFARGPVWVSSTRRPSGSRSCAERPQSAISAIPLRSRSRTLARRR
ncbi:hypothetical protein BH18ACT13_BH18ACT13_02830 [soil metagenome]